MDEKTEDFALVSNTLTGDIESFTKLVDKYQNRIYRLIFGVLKHVEDAEDVTQETFIHAFRALEAFRFDAAFYTWLYRIALNRALSSLQQQRRRNAHLYPDGDDGSDSEPAWSEIPCNDTPVAYLERKQALQIVERILAEMPEQFADALILRVFDGLSYEEISNASAMPINTVRSRIFRARGILADKMSNMHGISRPSLHAPNI